MKYKLISFLIGVTLYLLLFDIRFLTVGGQNKCNPSDYSINNQCSYQVGSNIQRLPCPSILDGNDEEIKLYNEAGYEYKKDKMCPFYCRTGTADRYCENNRMCPTDSTSILCTGSLTSGFESKDICVCPNIPTPTPTPTPTPCPNECSFTDLRGINQCMNKNWWCSKKDVEGVFNGCEKYEKDGICIQIQDEAPAAQSSLPLLQEHQHNLPNCPLDENKNPFDKSECKTAGHDYYRCRGSNITCPDESTETECKNNGCEWVKYKSPDYKWIPIKPRNNDDSTSQICLPWTYNDPSKSYPTSPEEIRSWLKINCNSNPISS